ncbi:heavy metal translocating P-type ATPase [Millisia brevis]|uniref:heavy metal translocating P-type ATPase n=1 Tax=Millisia brevis TaxID=264148 RepID=UPI00082AE542|nr:heavy metal translocating P-type ATPase [Millisia brevis]
MSANDTSTRPTGSAHADTHAHGHGGNAALELGFAITAVVTYLIGLTADLAFDQQRIALILFLATFFFGGFFTVRTAITSTLRGRFEVDFLMLVAAVGAASIGRWAEGAVLLALFSIGHALEEYAMGRAKRSIEALAELAPATALVKQDDGEIVERPTAEVAIGDIVVIKPNARIAVDGVVVAGTSSVDQAPITGESIPVGKQPVDDPQRALAGGHVPVHARVFAGTINGSGLLEVAATANVGDTTLARVVTLVAESEQAKSPTQRFIDRFQRWYVPAVIATVLAVMGIGWMFVDEPFADSFYRAMVVLVAASPCALAIATPAAVLSGVARAARAGLLVKGGGPLELLGKVDRIAFDKTGTLTWGTPRLVATEVMDGVDRLALERTAYAVERLSDHPLAVAIVEGLAVRHADAPTAVDVASVTGRGVRGIVEGDEVLIGTELLLADAGIDVDGVRPMVETLQAAGCTTMIVARAGRPLGVLGVMDTPRAEARPVIEALRDGGVSSLVMISGDNQRVADAVGRDVGVDSALGGLLPEHKVEQIKLLSRDGAITAMVGDGVNDAPAMANSSVGIAMGAAGSAAALETADVAIMGDDIGRVPFLMRLSAATTRIVRQNLVFSLAIVVALVPLSILGFDMGPVVLVHEGSTLIVIANALRLLRFEHGREHAGIEHEDRPA